MGGQDINRGGAKIKIGRAMPPMPLRWRRAWIKETLFLIFLQQIYALLQSTGYCFVRNEFTLISSVT